MTHPQHIRFPSLQTSSLKSCFPNLDDVLPILSQSKPRPRLDQVKLNRCLLSPRLTATITVVSIVALAISCYLAWVGLTSSKVAGCDGGVFDCSHVMTSRWSQVLGVPVGVPAAALYGVLLLTIAGTHSTSRRWQKRSIAMIWVLSLTAALSAVWFLSIQLALIGRLCPYCLAVHGCGLLMAGLMWHSSALTKVTRFRLSGLSIGLVAGLIVTQLFSSAPPTFVIEEMAPVAPKENLDPAVDGAFEAPLFDAPDSFDAPDLFDAPQSLRSPLRGAVTGFASLLASPATWIGVVMAPQAGVNQADTAPTAAQATAKKMVFILGRTKTLDANRWPLWGNGSSDNIVVEMFDYTCSHCRNTHRAIKEASQQLGGDLAILALPVPLHRSCNDAATSDSPDRAGACEIARMAVAVWLIDRSKFSHFHDWLFQQARSTDEARRYAEVLVGAEQLRKELGKPTASQYIARHVDLYKQAGRGTVPKLIFPTTTVVGEVSSGSTIATIVREKLK